MRHGDEAQVCVEDVLVDRDVRATGSVLGLKLQSTRLLELDVLERSAIDLSKWYNIASFSAFRSE